MFVICKFTAIAMFWIFTKQADSYLCSKSCHISHIMCWWRRL